uniref:Uncharacterized protein n=1 Tax=Magallana gigas TaxID=29159 RepID=A0A8W8JAX0_MAGGI
MKTTTSFRRLFFTTIAHSGKVLTALSPDVLETITAQVTQRVTATIRHELTTLINNINSNSASNSQGSISINPLGASNNNDNDGLVRESRHLDNAIQHSVEAVVVDHTEKIAGKSVFTTGTLGRQQSSQHISTTALSKLGVGVLFLCCSYDLEFFETG